jgi:GNAT superfamily N-acetyltransferase
MGEIQLIRCSDVFAALESAELLAEYAAECSIPLIGKIDPQPAIYEALERSGALQCFGLFEGGKFAGFATVLVTPSPHYGKKLAVVESLFLGKKFRSAGRGNALMDAVENFARERECAAIGYSARSGSTFEKLLTLLRPYERTNSVFMRTL